MIGIFKQKNPGNAVVLLGYALVLKFPLFLHAQPALQLEGDNYFYTLLLNILQPVAKSAPVIYSIIAFILVFTQATFLNRLCNNLKLFPKSNLLIAMSYLLVTSLVKEWHVFSAPLIVNSLLIWIWYSMMGWYNSPNPKTHIFNTSLLVGLLPLIYSPAIAYVILLIFALLVIRPPRITEWLVSVIGLITPYYFLFVVLFLTNQWGWSKVVPEISFHLPKLPSSLWVISGIVLMALPFLIGAYYVQDNLNKMLIQVRKSWSMLLLLMLVSLLITLANPGKSYQHWLMLVVPMATFHAAAYNFSPSKWFPLLLHWVLFSFAILLHYVVR